MEKRNLALIFSVIFIFILIIVFFFYYVSVSGHIKYEVKLPTSENIGEDHILYLLNELDAWKLHRSTLNKEEPRILITLSDKKKNYFVKIIDGQLIIREVPEKKIDLKIITTSDEVLAAIHSNPKEYIKKSISNGKTKIEPEVGHVILFSKGYLHLYKEMTGKTLTGSIIKIVSDSDF